MKLFFEAIEKTEEEIEVEEKEIEFIKEEIQEKQEAIEKTKEYPKEKYTKRIHFCYHDENPVKPCTVELIE